MGFKKYFKTIAIVVISYIAGHYIYDKYIKIGFNTVAINVNNLCQNAKSSYFTFNFSDRNVTVKDINQSVEKIYTNKINLNNNFYLQCRNKNKYFILNHGAILKTKNDSIDIENDYEKIHGYMGEWIKNNCYFVDKSLKFAPCRLK